MRYHHQNLSDGKLPLWRSGRAWLGCLAWEWHVFQKVRFGIEVGRRHFSLRLPGLQLYLHSSSHEAFDEPRCLSVSFHDGSLWIKHPFVRPGGDWRRDDPWWKKQITVDVVDLLIGRRRCTATMGKPFETFVPMPEGSYRATAIPETHVWRRRWYWPLRRRDSVYLRIQGGIPFSGKGENSWDCGDDGLWSISGETLERAIGNAVASALESRRRHGHDSKGTGRAPLRVCNAEVPR